MNYTYIPEALLYKRKSIDKLAMLHPINAIVFKRIMKLDGWNGNYSRESQVIPCLNNAYYICTIMRLEYDATFREDSYKRIARNGFIEGKNTMVECVTLSLVALLIEHSTPEWRNKLQELADNLRTYAGSLYDEREESVMGFPDVKGTNIVHLIGIPFYVSKDIDDSWVLPDELFQPRVLDEKAIYDMHRQDPTFGWDKYYHHYDEDDFREMIEKLGKTPQEKAVLIHSLWKDIYMSRKKYDGPIKEIWIGLKALAQEFCPEYMEKTGLHKIPDTGVEFEKRIHELEAEVESLKKQMDNVHSESTAESSEGKAKLTRQEGQLVEANNINAQQAARIKELEEEVGILKKQKETWVVELFSHFCYEDMQDAKDIIDEMRDKSDPEIADIIFERKNANIISSKTTNIDMWRVLHAAKIYESDSFQNLDTALRRRKNRKQ